MRLALGTLRDFMSDMRDSKNYAKEKVRTAWRHAEVDGNDRLPEQSGVTKMFNAAFDNGSIYANYGSVTRSDLGVSNGTNSAGIAPRGIGARCQ